MIGRNAEFGVRCRRRAKALGAATRLADRRAAWRRGKAVKKPSKKTSEKHVAFLKQGVTAWNAWRGENLDIRPDLSGADLSEANLSGANVSGANLRGAIVVEANLRDASCAPARSVRTGQPIAATSRRTENRRCDDCAGSPASPGSAHRSIAVDSCGRGYRARPCLRQWQDVPARCFG